MSIEGSPIEQSPITGFYNHPIIFDCPITRLADPIARWLDRAITRFP